MRKERATLGNIALTIPQSSTRHENEHHHNLMITQEINIASDNNDVVIPKIMESLTVLSQRPSSTGLDSQRKLLRYSHPI